MYPLPLPHPFFGGGGQGAAFSYKGILHMGKTLIMPFHIHG